MPYIWNEDRPEYDKNIYRLVRTVVGRGRKRGDANYIICKLIWSAFIKGQKQGYDNISTSIDIASDAHLEMCRRLLWPHEDKRIDDPLYGEVFV